MADKKLESITFPDLPDRYVVKPDVADVTGLQTALDGKADKTDVYNGFVSENIQGSIASFDDGADDIPVKSLVADIVPVQSGSGDPSPDNVRAISGWNGCNVSVAGKNLIDPSWLNDEAGWQTKVIKLKPNTNYTASTNLPSAKANDMPFYYYPTGYSPGSSIQVYDGHPVTLQTDTDGYATIRWRRASGTDSFANYHWQLEEGSTATTYEPYNGETYSIDWTDEAGTVYGGSIDVTTGVLTVTDANIASYNGETLPSTWISDRDVYAIGTTPTTGAQVVYKLATPQTYQLTPTEVKTLLGNNNVWADTGDIDLTYRADLGLYLDKIINA